MCRNARVVNEEAKRARCNLKEFVLLVREFLGLSDADLDPEVEADKIARRLNNPKNAETVPPISKHVIRAARQLQKKQRPWDFIRGIS